MGEYVKEWEKATVRRGGAPSEESTRLVFGTKRKFHSDFECEMAGGSEEMMSPSAETTCACSDFMVDASDGGVNEERLRALNLEENSVGVESRSEDCDSVHGSYSGEATSSSEHSGDSKDLIIHSPYSSTNPRRHLTPPPRTTPSVKIDVMPSTAALEEFFSAAEKYEQKRFMKKYNYDVVKDVPLEGRYQWVPLHP